MIYARTSGPLLHGIGVSPSWAIFGTTMYGRGTIFGAWLTAPLVDRLGVERVLTWVLAFGALCVLSIGLFDPPFGCSQSSSVAPALALADASLESTRYRAGSIRR
jgi:predicted MFS family arabinose efflux permease